ncbi:MAG: hypothetical protein ACYYKD_05650 [Rhodospirillales bacterium]
MPGATEYRFKINAPAPGAIPMARLAEYMAGLAGVLGEPEHVHCIRVENGGAELVQIVDGPAALKVRKRISGLPQGEGPPDALRAFRETNARLRADNAAAVLSGGEGGDIKFPGREAPTPLIYGPLKQEGSLDGRITSIGVGLGGAEDPVPVSLQQDGKVYLCSAAKETASELGRFLFDHEVRVHGLGEWLRNASGEWECGNFHISRFEVLKSQTLSEAVADLRKIPGSGWAKVDDIWSELAEIRGAGDKPH